MTQEETGHPLVSLASLTIETFFVRYLISAPSSYHILRARALIIFSVLFFPDICNFLYTARELRDEATMYQWLYERDIQ
jgi:hypothetical protein